MIRRHRGCARRAVRTPERAAYLAFVVDVVERLINHQSVRLGGDPEGVRFITVSNRRSGRGYLWLGAKVDGRYQTGRAPERPLEYEPFRLDVPAWKLLDLDWAFELADREIERLADIQFPEWWRTAERNTFLEALLRLHAAKQGQFCA